MLHGGHRMLCGPADPVTYYAPKKGEAGRAEWEVKRDNQAVIDDPNATPEAKHNATVKLHGKSTLATPDLTDKALRDARNAEFARNRAKRGRKSQFLADSGWEDPMGTLSATSPTLGDVTPKY